MMKNIIYIIGFTFLIACNSSQEKVVSVAAEIDSSENDTIKVDKSEFDLNGTWGLTNYFDTIVENKKLAKYRLQIPTWSLILLEIDNDSLKSFGSINNDKYLIEKTNDTLTTLKSNVSGDKWFLIVKDTLLKLIQYPNSKRIDSTIYTFRKRNDLNNFTKENTGFFVIGKNVTEYFNQQIFEGKYFKLDTKTDITFKADGSLIGIADFDTYEVRNYFGTLHMHKNLDVITFKNKSDNEFKQYNWVFNNDQLILTEFVYEKVTHNGKTYDGDYIVLGKEKIILKRH